MSSQNIRLVRWLSLSLILGVVIWVNAGDINPPPGPIAPTMKTLVEVEPRVAVNGLPGAGTAKHQISQSGSYYFTSNITSTLPGESGILITADDVTIDLCGFVLSGTPGTVNGVIVSGPRQDIRIENGTITRWGSDGIDSFSATNSTLQKLRASNNIGTGLRLGSSGTMLDCISQTNGGNGIYTDASCVVTNCVSSSNGGSGIVADKGTLLTNCTSRGNAANGIQVSDDCVVDKANVSQNGSGGTDAGIQVTGAGNRIDGNHITNCNSRGIRVASAGNLIVRNSVRAATVLAYDIVATDYYAQILNLPGANFTSCVAWANFSDQCPSGLTLCGNTCVDTQNDVNNCGNCGVICPPIPNMTASCQNGQCVYSCDAGYSDCNGNLVDGCEVYIAGNDNNNCGGCNLNCPPGYSCVNGVCVSGGCQSAGDCPPRANMTVQCINNICTYSCVAGYADCNGIPNDGCERNLLTSNSNCGMCGHMCQPGFNCVNGTCQP